MVKGRQRSQKWYFKNEKEVMKELGFKPTTGSGSGWIEKEDGENDYILAQLKSTDHESYKLKQFDLERLEYNADVSSKIPLFILQFLNNDTRYAIVALDDIPLIAKYMKTGEIKKMSREANLNLEEPTKIPTKPKIQSSVSARNKFYKQKEEERERRKWKQ